MRFGSTYMRHVFVSFMAHAVRIQYDNDRTVRRAGMAPAALRRVSGREEDFGTWNYSPAALRSYRQPMPIFLLAAASLACLSPQQASTHDMGVDHRGDQAMGFSHEKTRHHFLLYRDGGAIQIVPKDRKDTGSISAIRDHLKMIAPMFRARRLQFADVHPRHHRPRHGRTEAAPSQDSVCVR